MQAGMRLDLRVIDLGAIDLVFADEIRRCEALLASHRTRDEPRVR